MGEEKGRSHAASSCPDTNLMEALNPRWIWQIEKEEKLRHRGIKRLPVELGVPGVRKKGKSWDGGVTWKLGDRVIRRDKRALAGVDLSSIPSQKLKDGSPQPCEVSQSTPLN